MSLYICTRPFWKCLFRPSALKTLTSLVQGTHVIDEKIGSLGSLPCTKNITHLLVVGLFRDP